MTPYYADDHATLYHGNWRDFQDEWAGPHVDLLLTDPPYGRNWRQGGLKGARRPGGSPRQVDDTRAGIAGDKDTTERDQALTAWEMATDRRAIVFGDLMLPPPRRSKLTAVYAKPVDAGARGAIGGLRRDAEAIYLIGPWPSRIGGRTSIFRTTASQVSNVSGIAAQAGGHPHAKPLDVLAALLNLAPDANTIADPFTGSGSILVAAKLAGRQAVGVEIEERYCEIAARRLAQDVLDFGDAS